MKIATWNVNSIRSRLEHVKEWITSNQIDIICLQETKVVDKDFPVAPFQEVGYNTYISGQKSYNGVAIFSLEPLEDIKIGFGSVLPEEKVGIYDDQKRVISGVIGDVRIVNLYVPNGSSIGSEKFEYKLEWFKLLQEYLTILKNEYPQEILVCGDFNIALEEKDIYTTKKENHIMASPTEKEALNNILELGFADVFRKFTSEGGHFSWWDYRHGGFPKNRGWRIDHIYLTDKLYEQASKCYIDIEPRKLVKPSDHTPVVCEL